MLEEIREVVAGRRASMPRARAMALLIDAGVQETERDFAAVLARESEPIDLRLLAAGHLGRLFTAAAEEILVQHMETSLASIRSVVMLALARVGRERAQRSLAAARREGRLREAAADFAAWVIDHRLGANDTSLSPPIDEPLLELAEPARDPIRVATMRADGAALVLSSLARDSVGIQPDERTVHEIRCGRRHLALVFDSAVARSVRSLAERRTIVGALARLDQEAGVYHPALLVLTRPGRAGHFTIACHRLTGPIIFRGTGQVVGQTATFSLRTVARPGALAIRLEGVLDAGSLRVTEAAAALSSVPKRPVTSGGRISTR